LNAPKDAPANSTKVVIGIGSNKDCEKNIIAALDALEERYGNIECSPVYKSAANTTEKSEQYRFYFNLVVTFFSNESLQACKKSLIQIEDQQGRKRHHADVSCDLDLLTFGGFCGTVDNINVPHKDILECDYVLRPLADLLPKQQHPENKKTYEQLWQHFNYV